MKATPAVRLGQDRAELRPFDTFAEQLLAIMRAESGEVDARLRPLQWKATATGMGENMPMDGGFAVVPDFAQQILNRSYQQSQILSRARRLPVGAGKNGMKIQAFDEDSRADGSRLGGVQAFWANEGDAATPKRPKLRQIETALKKLIGLYYMTSELEADGGPLSQLVMDGFSDEISFVTEDAIVNGSGSGQPLGILKSNALITVAAEGGQTAGTFVGANAAKMYGRLFAARDPSGVVWLVNQETLPQILTMVVTAASGAISTVIPAYDGDATPDAPYGRLFCRPIVPVEFCQKLGTPGDVLLVDLHEYLLTDKDPAKERSIHVKFLTDEVAFRITYRVDGQPVWKKDLTPKNATASVTVSPYVNLAAR